MGNRKTSAPHHATARAAADPAHGGPPAGHRGVSPWLLPSVAAIALLVAVSYFPALQGGFVWDDAIFSEEPVIHAPGGLRSIWFSPADIENEGHYWPLVYTTFWLEHKIWGLDPAGYHAVNILLHLINSLLVWRLTARLAVPGAILIAALFAAHPLHVESVAWIIERKDVLSALFYLTAVLTWMRFAETPGPGRYALTLALFAAGLLAKSVVVTLPVALLIWHWWQRGRVTAVDLLRLAPLVAVGLAITLADLAFYQSREELELGYSAVERALIAARALWFYVGKLLWPTGLAVIYPLWEVDAGDLLAWAYLAAAVASAVALWLARRRLARAAGGGAVLRGDAGAGAGVRGLRLHAVLVRCRPLSVPGGYRGAGGADRVGVARLGQAAAGLSSRSRRPGGRGGDGAGGADLAAGRGIPR